MRPMALEFPHDPAAEYLDRQYMLGDDLLVAPVFFSRWSGSLLCAGRNLDERTQMESESRVEMDRGTIRLHDHAVAGASRCGHSNAGRTLRHRWGI